MGRFMLLEELYSELAPKHPTPPADSLGDLMPGHGWAPKDVECPQVLCSGLNKIMWSVLL